MAVLALGLIGAAIAPAGFASIGWALGATLGQFLTQRKEKVEREGPRLADSRITAATWGVGIPLAYGTPRLAGNILWTSGRREHIRTSTQEIGGKGGGGGTSVTTTTYSYDIDLAIGICAGPIVGVRRIWANQNLIYNVSDTASSATITASNGIAQNVRFYVGDESQTQDPTMQAALGNVPGYRGLAYVVFTQLQLDAYGGVPPNFEFEVVTTGSGANLAKAITWQSATTSGVLEWLDNGIDSVMGFKGVSEGILIFNRANGAPMATLPSSAVTTWAGVPNTNFFPYGIALDPFGLYWVIHAGQVNGIAGTYLWRIPPTGVPDRVIRVSNSSGALATEQFEIDAEGSAFFRIGTQISKVEKLHEQSNWNLTSTSLTHVITPWWITGSGGVGVMVKSPTDGLIHMLSQSDGGDYRTDPGGLIGIAIAGFNTAGSFPYIRYDRAGRPWVAWTVATPSTHWELKRYNAGTGAIEQSIVLTDGEALQDFLFGHDGYLWVNLTGAWTKRYTSDGTIVASVTGDSANERGVSTTYGVFTAKASTASSNIYLLEPLPRLTATSATTVADAVTGICEAAGFFASELDVSALTDTLRNYIVGRPMTARDAIVPLMQAFFFDGVESDGKMKFVKRGSQSPITIPFSSMVTENERANFEYVRADESDAPHQVVVNFFNSDADSQDATQYARRLVSRAQQQLFFDLAIGLTPTEAAKIADVMLYNAHVERTRYRWRTGIEYAANEPTDIFFTTDDEGIDHVIRAVAKSEAGVTIDWEGVADLSAVYASAALGDAPQEVQTDVAFGGPTVLSLHDIPILRDSDNDAGFYARMSGTLPGWPGAVLHGSPDDAAYSELGAVNTAATAGYATTALGNFSGGNVIDRANSVTVTFDSGTPETIAEIDLLNGGNAALLGSEIVQFQTATLSSGTTYVLTGFLRGRRGTEQYMGGHQVGETFILLNASRGLLRVVRSATERGTQRYYRAPAFGSSLATASTVPFTNWAQGLRPLSPVYLFGTRNDPSTNYWTFRWIRRGRISPEWMPNVDVPIGENTESYEIDIVNTSTLAVVRTLTSSTPTVTYTEAEQIENFGSAQTTVRARVYQISAIVGRGFGTEGTFSG
jgi:hypothetical protein